MRRWWVVVLALAACSGPRSDEEALATAEDEAAVAAARRAADTVRAQPRRVERAEPEVIGNDTIPAIAMLTAARIGKHEEVDRIVFEFVGTPPEYHIEYIDRPVRQCGSGDVVPLPGDAWLSIRFEPANAHTEAGEPSVQVRDIEVTGRNLLRVKLICDFEAVVEWIAAVGSPGRFKVLELKDPARVVVDIAN